MISQVIFFVLILVGVILFRRNVKKIIRNIRLGRPENRSDNPPERWKKMLKVALGQSKMVARPVPAILHLMVYAGFIIINIEILEIILDGLLGTHRVFASPMAGFYNFIIAFFEGLAIAVILACAVFLIRRNVLKISRFKGIEMQSWPRSDANYILIFEIALMVAF